MPGQTPRPFGSIALVATLLMSGVGVSANTARADHCLAAPNSTAPQGSHWYYRLDWATQRKCWYLRAPGKPAQQAAAPATMRPATPHSMPAPSEPIPAADGAPMSVSPGDIPPPSPHVKLPAPVIGATTDKIQQSAQEGNSAPSMTEAPAPQASTSSQTSAQAAGPAPAGPPAWPDAPPAVATVKAQESIAVPTDARADSVRHKAQAQAFDDAERTAWSSESTNNAGMPMIFPVLALGLAVAGALSLVVMKIAAERRARNDDQRQYEWHDDQDQHGSVDERHSLIWAVSDHGPFRDEGGAFRITHEISKRRDKLAGLHQHLDWLLQSPAGPHDEPRHGQTAAC
jgi:hypothetical protein